MVTFSDLITLLLTFFVLLISMSSMDIKALKNSFGMFTGGSGPLNYADMGQIQDLAALVNTIEDMPENVLINQEELKDMLFQFDELEFRRLMDLVDRDIQVFRDERGLVIQLADYILFNEGGAEVRQEYLPILSRVANLLRVSRQPISIEGHTDDSAIEGGRTAWAWELSLERATALLYFFTQTEGLLAERFRVGGFGPSKPLVANDSPKNRARNRRIEIILYKEEYS
jgi:chemotaxis protein MotB